MKSRVIVITGATRGLGRALIEEFVNLGHDVFGCGRTVPHIEKLRHDFPKGHFTAIDVTDAAAMIAWAKHIYGRVSAPALLINNAGVMNALAPLWKIPAEDFDRVIDVNVKGVANSIRAFVPVMVAKKRGVIVNLSSGWGRSTSPKVAPYCASKFAVEGMTRALAQELPAGMAAVALNPGVIDTDMLRSAWGDEAAKYPDATTWAKRAAPLLLGLDASDNGQSLTVPD